MSEPIIDAHLHLWDLDNPWYPGLKQMADALSQPGLYSTFLIDDYRRAAGDLRVERFVHVSAVTAPGTYLDELRWAVERADADGLDMRFVGTVDPSLTPSEITGELDRQREITDKLAGIRVLYEFEPDSVAAATVLSWLERTGLVFDLVTAPDAMTDWLKTLSRYPGLRVVLEHTGWPAGTTADDQVAWLDAIGRCARDTSASCKVSGLGMTTLDLTQNTLRPWVERAIEVFGWDRVIFGSNIPIEHMAGTYTQLQDSLDGILASATPDQRRKFYHDNAFSTYGFEAQTVGAER